MLWDCFLKNDMHVCCQTAACRPGKEHMKHEQTSREKATTSETRSGLQPIVKQGPLVEGFVLTARLMPEAQHASWCWVLNCDVTWHMQMPKL